MANLSHTMRMALLSKKDCIRKTFRRVNGLNGTKTVTSKV